MARPIGLPGLVGVLVAVLVAAAAPAASATQFRVGGQKGWSVPDAGDEPYNTWAGRLRFQIGDQLLFVYPKETDSVLLVDAAAYNACNTSSYVTRFDDGSTVFTFDRSGPFFFISGNDASCRANEKLIVVVLAPRTPPAMTPQPPPPASSAPPAPSPTSSPPPSGAAPPLPAPAATPTSPPTPEASAPAPAPAATTPTISPPMPAPTSTPKSSPPAPAGPASPPSTTLGGASQPPSASANAPGARGSGSTTPPPPSASGRSAVAGFVGSLAAFVGYAMLAA